jgi:hypothetical protein
LDVRKNPGKALQPLENSLEGRDASLDDFSIWSIEKESVFTGRDDERSELLP